VLELTKNREAVYKLTLSAVLAALSVVIKLAFDLWIQTDFFGFPFYSIPLILSGLFLGPYYAFLIALVADTVSGIVLGYLPMFVFSTIAWALIPCLLTREAKGVKWWVVIFLTYLVATICNTFAIWVHFSWGGAIGSLTTRLAVLPAFSLLIALVTSYIFTILKDTRLFFEDRD
jgi:ECF transporter S component (folate family)